MGLDGKVLLQCYNEVLTGPSIRTVSPDLRTGSHEQTVSTVKIGGTSLLTAETDTGLFARRAMNHGTAAHSTDQRGRHENEHPSGRSEQRHQADHSGTGHGETAVVLVPRS